ncbi:uncharacterized protein CBO05P1_093 [Clostridium botulinum B str. Osaka05]|uniref:Uncharacterized protein n=1 Tax=Clostridium botulinum B str. Osaka05 TaxID=1407017 RepID=A0A060N4T5_CLOBO|nr:hypothetical protein [Clostridium botulinum]BAO04812.1 uncharacterized protein CBO05P1_093 [Clostridium botulinum B str. Osaka05]
MNIKDIKFKGEDSMEFNWDEFKNDYIAVHCNTIRQVTDFFNKCKENDIELCAEEYLNTELAYIIDDDNFLRRCQIDGLAEEGFDIIEWEIENKIDYDREYNIMEIMEFEEGTEFTLDDRYICKVKNEALRLKDGTGNWIIEHVNKGIINAKFKLIKKDKKVNFSEAMIGFQDGKTIYSNLNDIKKYYKLNNNTNSSILIRTEEILNGEWYIKED